MKKIKSFNTSIRELALNPGDNRISLPARAQVLDVSYRDGEQLTLTVIVDVEVADLVERRFYVVPQGARVPHNAGALTHIGSPRRHGVDARHVFEIDSPEERGYRKVSSGEGSISIEQHGPVNGTSILVGQVRGSIFDGSLPHPGVMIQ